MNLINQPQQLTHNGAVRLITTADQQTWLLVAIKPDFKPLNLATLPPPRPINNPGNPRLHGPPPPKGPMISPMMWLLIATLSSFVFSGLLAWYFTRPIRDLQTAFSEVAEGNLTTRLSPITLNRKDEFSKLGKQFDAMVGKLQQLINAQQTLLNDVSHELRSPLARMQAAIGIAQQQPDKQLATFDRLETEIEHINELVGELLVLSQVDTADNLLVTERLDFVEIVGEIVDDGMYEGTDKGIQIRFPSSEPIFIDGYLKLLRRAIENVIRNAIKFSPESGIIDVTVYKLINTVQLTIRDQGPGIDSQYLETMFEPFFHQDHQNRSGTGLGLAIAYRAINKHKGSIKASNNIDKGLSITIELPLPVNG
jgi:two-component system OmpR family sensor kinase